MVITQIKQGVKHERTDRANERNRNGSRVSYLVYRSDISDCCPTSNPRRNKE